MTINALFFAHYQDIVGSRERRMAVPTGATVGMLARQLEQDHTGLPDLLTHGRVAVNAEFADADTVLRHGDEVAWMPPMSGGREGRCDA